MFNRSEETIEMSDPRTSSNFDQTSQVRALPTRDDRQTYPPGFPRNGRARRFALGINDLTVLHLEHETNYALPVHLGETEREFSSR